MLAEEPELSNEDMVNVLQREYKRALKQVLFVCRTGRRIVLFGACQVNFSPYVTTTLHIV